MSLKKLNINQGVLIKNEVDLKILLQFTKKEDISIDEKTVESIKSASSIGHKFVFNPLFGFTYLGLFNLCKGDVFLLTDPRFGEEEKTKTILTRKGLIMIERENKNDELRDWIMDDLCENNMLLDTEEIKLSEKSLKAYSEKFIDPIDRELLIKYGFDIPLEVKQSKKPKLKLNVVFVVGY